MSIGYTLRFKRYSIRNIDRRPLNWNLIKRPFLRRGKSYISPTEKLELQFSFGYAEVTKQIKWRIEEERKSEGFAVIAKIKAEKNKFNRLNDTFVLNTCVFD